MKEIITIDDARQKMKNMNVIIYGTIRDIESHFFTSFTNLNIIANYFNKVFIIIFENDSIDKTRSLLTQWLNTPYKNVIKHLILKNELDSLYPLRAHRLAYCRNCILNYIADNNLVKEYNYALHCDLDDRFWAVDYNSMASCFQYDLNSWDCMTCVNKNRTYYDYWALRCETSWFNINIFSCDANNIDYNTKTAGFETLLKNTTGLLQVTSSFNGLGIYKLSSLIYCRYNAVFTCVKCNNEKRGCWEDNDHIGLHKHMLHNNCKLFINNRMYLQTKPQNSIHYKTFIQNMVNCNSIDKNILLYLLICESIDALGKWLLIESKDGDVANILTNHYSNTLYSYNQTKDTSTYLNKNIKISEGDFANYSHELNDISAEPITFMYINCNQYYTTKNILSISYNKIQPGCIIIFHKLVNYKDYEIHALKALYEFLQEYEISFEWFVAKGKIFPTTEHDLPIENQKVAIRITENKHFNRTFTEINYSSKEYENFNWIFYSNKYKDLHCIKTKEEAFHHWIHHGQVEGRVCSNDNGKKMTVQESIITDPEFNHFDWEIYIELNPDLKTIINKEQAFKHWKYHGSLEGRICKFDWCAYIKIFNLVSKSIDNKVKAVQHWLENGRPEINSNVDLNDELFDWEYYVSHHEDLKFIKEYETARYHWIHFGKNEKRMCHNFKWTTYLLANKDLVKSGITSETAATYHWLKHGKIENRKMG